MRGSVSVRLCEIGCGSVRSGQVSVDQVRSGQVRSDLELVSILVSKQQPGLGLESVLTMKVG